ncbi:DUF5069 domain-containing protein [Luteolibacter sp. SL250]|uniref:DUF5069 domain-containing protein n=1 Tax=Luteolibacter sp. SL250 TaxID=2995170 RepID=UPI00226E2D7C|nr:DUF5069 domain-containing protein [Luteolibacter sp. SL250]WAC18224.1 DUF5069 domain-containing protein [Luteolibacter sp. SL250]
MNPDALKPLATDLRTVPPRSPHETLGGYVIAARVVDKGRADLLGVLGEYNYHPCGLAAFLWQFTGVSPMEFRSFIATGADDDACGRWLSGKSKVSEQEEIVRWNNQMRCQLLCDLPDSYQTYYETYIPRYCPHPHRIRFFFDVYDDEEGRL